MSTLFASVARHRARLLRTSQSANVTTRAHVTLYGSVLRHTSVLSLHDGFGKPSSFSTTANRAEKQKKSSTRPSRTPRDARGDRATTDPRDPSGRAATQSTAGIDRSKIEWMKQSAENGDYPAVLRAVYDCYKPLYATHPLLMDKESSLLTAAASGAAATPEETPFQPVEYDNLATQLTEKHAMALFRTSKQMNLALAVWNHREWIASTLGETSLADGTRVDFGRYIPPLRFEAMQTHYWLRDYVQVETVYDQAIHQGVLPTSKMARTCIYALIETQECAKALELYQKTQEICDENRSDDPKFYQQLLYAARMTLNSQVAKQVKETAESKGYTLEVQAYFNVMASFDAEYYFIREDDRPAGSISNRSLYYETYYQCVDRIAEQKKASADKYASIEAASYQVLELFHEMVNVHHLKPEKYQFFPRVMTAAMLLGQYDAVKQCMDFYQPTAQQEKKMDPVAVRIATNALLVQNDPVAAWELVLSTYGTVFDNPRASEKARTVAATPLAYVVQYLNAKSQTTVLKQLLALLGEQGRLTSALSEYGCHCAMTAFMFKAKDISHDDLWQLVVVDYAQIFPVLTDSKWLTVFINVCASAGRWPLVMKAIHARDKSLIPEIIPHLATFALEDVTESGSKPELMDLNRIAQLPDMVVASSQENDVSIDDPYKVALACIAIRALDILRQKHQQQCLGNGGGGDSGASDVSNASNENEPKSESKSESKSEKLGDMKREILRLHGQYLIGAPVDTIPKEVQEMVQQAQLE